MERIILLENISKIYKIGDNEVYALNNIDLTIKKNEFIAIMGSSGSGKSTMLNLLGCLDKPTKGSYILGHRNVETLDDVEIAEIRNKEIGFVFQNFNLLQHYNALNNILVPLVYSGESSEDKHQKALDLLKLVGLENRWNHKPGELSGGQKQRVAIARALINDPSVILADEPTGNLDSKTSIDIMNILQELHQKGNTIILVTHEEDIASCAQRIIRLKDGIIESDTLT